MSLSVSWQDISYFRSSYSAELSAGEILQALGQYDKFEPGEKRLVDNLICKGVLSIYNTSRILSLSDHITDLRSILADQDKSIGILRKHINKEISQWYGKIEPSDITGKIISTSDISLREPIIQWAERAKESGLTSIDLEDYLGDIYTASNGMSYRFAPGSTAGSYTFLPIADTGLAKVIQDHGNLSSEFVAYKRDGEDGYRKAITAYKDTTDKLKTISVDPSSYRLIFGGVPISNSLRGRDGKSVTVSEVTSSLKADSSFLASVKGAPGKDVDPATVNKLKEAINSNASNLLDNINNVQRQLCRAKSYTISNDGVFQRIERDRCLLHNPGTISSSEDIEQYVPTGAPIRLALKRDVESMQRDVYKKVYKDEQYQYNQRTITWGGHITPSYGDWILVSGSYSTSRYIRLADVPYKRGGYFYVYAWQGVYLPKYNGVNVYGVPNPYRLDANTEWKFVRISPSEWIVIRSAVAI